MGCDIHILVERNVDGEWICVNTMSAVKDARHGNCYPNALDRNYERFAKLAGVRGDGPKPRGWPADVSQTASFIHGKWSSDGHSHSWMSVAEAAPIFLETEFRGLDSYAYSHPADFYFNVDDRDMESHRIVFFFDN